MHIGIMNRLPIEEHVRILAALVEGNSVRGTARMVGVDKKTVLRLLADVGDGLRPVPGPRDQGAALAPGSVR
jgi:transposase-like protein